jgi:hypothetical protein
VYSIKSSDLNVAIAQGVEGAAVCLILASPEYQVIQQAMMA